MNTKIFIENFYEALKEDIIKENCNKPLRNFPVWVPESCSSNSLHRMNLEELRIIKYRMAAQLIAPPPTFLDCDSFIPIEILPVLDSCLLRLTHAGYTADQIFFEFEVLSKKIRDINSKLISDDVQFFGFSTCLTVGYRYFKSNCAVSCMRKKFNPFTPAAPNDLSATFVL